MRQGGKNDQEARRVRRPRPTPEALPWKGFTFGEISIPRQRQQRPGPLITGVFEIKDFGEAGAGEPGVVPGAVGELGGEEVVDAAGDGGASECGG